MKFICRKPGKKSREILRRDHKIISQSLTREYSFVFQRASGPYIWDVDGRRYLDFAGGVAVANVGHTNPAVVRAIREQARKAIHAGFSDFYAELPVLFAEKLVSFLPSSLNNVFLSNSGTEAVEATYKLARWHTKKKFVIAFKPCFHGRTMGSLSLTNSKRVQRERYSPFLPVIHSPYPYQYRMDMDAEECSNFCLTELEKNIKKVKNDLAAIFLEPVAGEPGYIVPPKSFVRGLRKLCDSYGVLLVADEVQSGCFRTGKFLAIENFGVNADIVSLSKAIGGGVPLGATVASKRIMNWPSGSHANTFGGNLLACAAGIASLDFMKRKKLGENSKRIGKLMMKRFQEMQKKYEIIGDVRGLGLMIGLELVRNRKNKKPAFKERNAVLCNASEKGLLLLGAGTDENACIRICPPLIISRQQAEHGLDILEDSIAML